MWVVGCGLWVVGCGLCGVGARYGQAGDAFVVPVRPEHGRHMAHDVRPRNRAVDVRDYDDVRVLPQVDGARQRGATLHPVGSAFNNAPMPVKSISVGFPRVPRARAYRACGEPNGIKTWHQDMASRQRRPRGFNHAVTVVLSYLVVTVNSAWFSPGLRLSCSIWSDCSTRRCNATQGHARSCHAQRQGQREREREREKERER